jgi:hypothetical protein
MFRVRGTAYPPHSVSACSEIKNPNRVRFSPVACPASFMEVGGGPMGWDAPAAVSVSMSEPRGGAGGRLGSDSAHNG